MADLVERLRKLSDDCMEDGYEDQGIGLHDAADELDRLRAEVASLKEENGRAVEGHRAATEVSTEYAKQNRNLTQQLATANGRVERMRKQIVAAHPYIGLHNPARDILDAALSALPEADKEKS